MSKSTLYIKWTEHCEGAHPLLDEQHRGLVATINSIHYFIHQGWELNKMTPTLKMLEMYVGFHLGTEAEILRKFNAPESLTDALEEYRKSFLLELRQVTDDAIRHQEPEELTRYLAKWWMGHRTNFHDKVDALLVSE